MAVVGIFLQGLAQDKLSQVQTDCIIHDIHTNSACSVKLGFTKAPYYRPLDLFRGCLVSSTSSICIVLLPDVNPKVIIYIPNKQCSGDSSFSFAVYFIPDLNPTLSNGQGHLYIISMLFQSFATFPNPLY